MKERFKNYQSIKNLKMNFSTLRNLSSRRVTYALESPPSPSLRSVVPHLRFKNHCFLCAEKIRVKYFRKYQKKHLSERDFVYDVTKLSVKDGIVQIASNRSDDWSREIIERMQNVSDLMASDANHHNSCMKKLYRTP